MATEVTDPDLLAQLNGQSSARQEITDPAILSQLNGEQQSPPSSGFDNFLRQTALQGRAAAQGVVGALTLPQTLMTGAQNLIPWSANKLLGTNYPLRSTPAQAFSQGLTLAGAPVPQSSGEQLASAATSGVTGALSGAGVAGMAGGAALRAGASGLTGGLSQESARQIGLPPWMQFGAGILGGQIPAATESFGRTFGDLIAPVTAGGQARAAGTLLNAQASNPGQAMQNLDASSPIVADSMPTMGSASQDIGLLSVEKAMRGKNPAPFGERLGDQNTARQAELSTMAGTPADIAAAAASRDAQTSATREAAFANASPADVTPVLAKINSVLAGPVGKRDIASQALTWLKGKLVDADGNPETDAQNLYAVRQDINDAIAGKLGGDQSKFRLAQGQLLQARGDLDNAIETAAPGFKGYLSQYAALSKPINRMESLQDLQQSSNLTAADVKTGQYFMSPAGFSRGLDKLKGDPFSGVQDEHLTRLEALRRDLQNSQAIASPSLRAIGSDTFQNLSLSQSLGSGMLTKPIAKVLEVPYRLAGADSGVNEQLMGAMLDPKRAAALMRAAAVARPEMSFRPYDVGTLFGTGLPGQR